MSEPLNEPGPEARFLSLRAGIWDVTETVWPAPHAAPVISTGLVGERVMIGTLIQEFIRLPGDTTHSAVKRTDLLCYNRLDGRWDYVSFDRRDPVGFMPAWSLDRQPRPDRIKLRTHSRRRRHNIDRPVSTDAAGTRYARPRSRHKRAVFHDGGRHRHGVAQSPI